MAKKSAIAREVKRAKCIKRYAEKRKQLRQQAADVNASPEEQYQARIALLKLPRNSSPARLTRRCVLCGRPKAVYRKFGLCRICLRERLMTGDVPGGRKASW